MHNPFSASRAVNLPGRLVGVDGLVSAPVTEPEVTALAEELAADVRRVADRLRSLSQARLAAPCPPYDSAADAGRVAAQALADAAAAVAAATFAGAAPVGRELPRLSDFSVGDQVAVTGQDLVTALAAAGAGAPGAGSRVVDGAGAGPALDQAAAAARLLADVRRRI